MDPVVCALQKGWGVYDPKIGVLFRVSGCSVFIYYFFKKKKKKKNKIKRYDPDTLNTLNKMSTKVYSFENEYLRRLQIPTLTAGSIYPRGYMYT